MARFQVPVVTGLPAYGRKYKTIEAIEKDWKDGKDFQCKMTGQYFSIRDVAMIVKDWQTQFIDLYSPDSGLIFSIETEGK